MTTAAIDYLCRRVRDQLVPQKNQRLVVLAIVSKGTVDARNGEGTKNGAAVVFLEVEIDLVHVAPRRRGVRSLENIVPADVEWAQII